MRAPTKKSLLGVVCTNYRLNTLPESVKEELESIDTNIASNLPGHGIITIARKGKSVVSIWLFGYKTDHDLTLLISMTSPGYDPNEVLPLIITSLRKIRDDWTTVVFSSEFTLTRFAFSVRRVEFGDPVLIPFAVEAWKYLLDMHLADPTDIYIHADTKAFMAFSDAGTPVGIIAWSETWNNTAFISMGYVSPGNRRMGVYTKLFEALTQYARENNLKRIRGSVRASNGQMLTVAAKQNRTFSSFVMTDYTVS